MSRLQKETEILETQKKIMEGNLTLLQKQIDRNRLILSIIGNKKLNKLFYLQLTF